MAMDTADAPQMIEHIRQVDSSNTDNYFSCNGQ